MELKTRDSIGHFQCLFVTAQKRTRTKKMAPLTMMLRCFAILLCLCRFTAAQECSINEHNEDKNMVEIEFEGDKFMAYVQPHVTSFYKEVDPPASTAVTPMHEGFAGKFINLSKDKMMLFWEPYEGAKDPSLMRVMPPFFGGGSATFPTHRFYFSTEDDPHTPVKRFIVQDYPESLYVYDPYHVQGDEEQTEQNLSILT